MFIKDWIFNFFKSLFGIDNPEYYEFYHNDDDQQDDDHKKHYREDGE